MHDWFQNFGLTIHSATHHPRLTQDLLTISVSSVIYTANFYCGNHVVWDPQSIGG